MPNNHAMQTEFEVSLFWFTCNYTWQTHCWVLVSCKLLTRNPNKSEEGLSSCQIHYMWNSVSNLHQSSIHRTNLQWNSASLCNIEENLHNTAPLGEKIKSNTKLVMSTILYVVLSNRTCHGYFLENNSNNLCNARRPPFNNFPT